ncbi:head decoration protein [Pseudoxanthomonas winnipegensis]|uniref:Head decoration protein n=1 Tax=Pseudoxanthomonas winnipegensis TaxID=2480810 RepID=A0A4Q8M4X1_9GAMM|nr:head decoration protein [Pseudoxanthomonas winnipegensis]TAA42474.1 head decoration protein [Pseudoxanthomonas winnipegensis]
MDLLMTNGVRTAAFLLSEANGERSRELITIPGGQGKLSAGTLLNTDNEVAEDFNEAIKVLYGAVDTGDAPEQGETVPPVKGVAINYDAEVHGELLAWPEGTTDDQKLIAANALDAAGIVTRWTEKPVASGAAHHIEFINYPSSATAGAPAGNVVAHVKDVFGALVTGSTASVTLTKATGPGTLSNGGAKAAVDGVVTWQDVSFSAAGTVTLSAVATGLTPAVSDDITVAAA